MRAPSPDQLLVLQILSKSEEGMYAPEIVEKAAGKLSKFRVYTVLENLALFGYIYEIEEPTEPGKLARTKHCIRLSGMQALELA